MTGEDFQFEKIMKIGLTGAARLPTQVGSFLKYKNRKTTPKNG